MSQSAGFIGESYINFPLSKTSYYLGNGTGINDPNYAQPHINNFYLTAGALSTGLAHVTGLQINRADSDNLHLILTRTNQNNINTPNSFKYDAVTGVMTLSGYDPKSAKPVTVSLDPIACSGMNVSFQTIQATVSGQVKDVIILASDPFTTSTPSFPFQVTSRTNPDNPALYQAKINLQSSLLKSIIPTDRQIINGLDTWFNLDGNDFIWLEVIIFPLSAHIASYGLQSFPVFEPSTLPGQSNNSPCGPFDYDFILGTPNIYGQTKARIPIAYSIANETGAPILHQQLNQNLILSYYEYFGNTQDGLAVVPLTYFSPWIPPYLTS